jgi:ATP-dependent Clp protease ATP-binding subunit ClpB
MKIVDIQIERMKRYLKDKNVSIILTDKAKVFLAEIGYDQVYGARPLKRAIQKEILTPLATKLLDGSFKSGDIIEVYMEVDRPVFRSKIGAEQTMQA